MTSYNFSTSALVTLRDKMLAETAWSSVMMVCTLCNGNVIIDLRLVPWSIVLLVSYSYEASLHYFELRFDSSNDVFLNLFKDKDNLRLVQARLC